VYYSATGTLLKFQLQIPKIDKDTSILHNLGLRNLTLKNLGELLEFVAKQRVPKQRVPSSAFPSSAFPHSTSLGCSLDLGFH
jgi:hypothetical protein